MSNSIHTVIVSMVMTRGKVGWKRQKRVMGGNSHERRPDLGGEHTVQYPDDVL